MTSIQMDSFHRPAHYWLQRAERCRQHGEPVRAAVLERHAVQAEPDHQAARMSYVFTLRRLGCYEASNREAFATLARHPEWTALYGLIGQNMFSLSQREAGIDAINLYLKNPPDIPPEWQDEAYDMMDRFSDPALRPKRRARLNGLLDIAVRRIQSGDVKNGGRALARANRPPYRQPNARRALIKAMSNYHDLSVTPVTDYLNAAMRIEPNDPETLSMVAAAASVMHCRREARQALLRAALQARTPSEEAAVCNACLQLSSPQIAYVMLKASRKRMPTRFPVCYNLCVALLKMGRLEEALPHIHLCREIDPDDVQGEALFERMLTLEQEEATPEQVRQFAVNLSYYGTPNMALIESIAGTLSAALGQGPEDLAAALCEDEHLYHHFLYLLPLPLTWTELMLEQVLLYMPKDRAAALCREILLQHPELTPVKKRALTALTELCEAPPFPTWTENHIGQVDPAYQPPTGPSASFRQRLTAVRLKQAAGIGGRELIPWALELLHRMNAEQRRALLGDPLRVWPAALALTYRRHHGRTLHIDPERLGEERMLALGEALAILRTLDRKD